MKDWEDLDLPTKCRAHMQQGLDVVLKMEQALNKYEVSNPTQYGIINERRTQIEALCGAFVYFGILIDQAQEKSFVEPSEFPPAINGLLTYKEKIEKILNKIN
jgi:hypothetical protein